LAGCAASLGRELGPVKERHLATRLVESDAELVIRGFEAGILRVEGNYLWTADPHQHTAWLVEGAPAHPCWEYLPHMAAYVEMALVHGYPLESLRFETPDQEMNLDLAVVAPNGAVRVLGEVKAEARQVEALALALAGFVTDPGKPPSVRGGGPQGARREAWKLAHQLWQLRAPWLWLAAAGTRLAFAVSYDNGLHLQPREDFPAVRDVGELSSSWSRIDRATT
jgi:hypothetical protein